MLYWHTSMLSVFLETTLGGDVMMLQVAWPAGPYSCSAIDLRSTAMAKALRTLRSEKNGCLVVGSERLSPRSGLGSAKLINSRSTFGLRAVINVARPPWESWFSTWASTCRFQ